MGEAPPWVIHHLHCRCIRQIKIQRHLSPPRIPFAALLLHLALTRVIHHHAQVIQPSDRHFHIPPHRRFRARRRLVRLFNRNHPPIRPRPLRYRRHRLPQLVHRNIQVLLPRRNRPRNPTHTNRRRIRVRHQHMQLQHPRLHRNVRILPAIEAMDRHVPALRRRRNHIQLLPLALRLGTLLRLIFGAGSVTAGSMASHNRERQRKGKA